MDSRCFFHDRTEGDLTEFAAGSTLRYSVNYVLSLEPFNQPASQRNFVLAFFFFVWRKEAAFSADAGL